jgi:predicted aspartyl protease
MLMGHTTATVRICNPQDRTKCIETELIVDTGSTYTWVRKERLEMIGVKPTGLKRFRTMEGKTIEREVGEAVIECLGESATRIVVFAEKGDAEVMGVDTLEGLGLEIDPVTKQLRKAESLLALTAIMD